MLYTKDINYYIDYLEEQDEIMCRKIQPSLFYNIGFITFDNTNNPKCITTMPRCARGKNIFNMRYIFIPIQDGLHVMCAVSYMEQMKIKYHEPSSVVLHVMLRLRGTVLGPEGCICNVLTGQFVCQDRGIVEHIIPFLNCLYVTLHHYPCF
jgi:hypothetical protein